MPLPAESSCQHIYFFCKSVFFLNLDISRTTSQLHTEPYVLWFLYQLLFLLLRRNTVTETAKEAFILAHGSGGVRVHQRGGMAEAGAGSLEIT